MDAADWDYFEEQIATLVLTEACTLPKAVGMICRKHPNHSADVLLLGVISFVTHLDNALGFADEKALWQSHNRYRAIAALAADIALLSPKDRTCQDLRQFWMSSSSNVFL
jgi:hypothetical protein